jgi:FixJ family two-component response regulator
MQEAVIAKNKKDCPIWTALKVCMQSVQGVPVARRTMDIGISMSIMTVSGKGAVFIGLSLSEAGGFVNGITLLPHHS